MDIEHILVLQECNGNFVFMSLLRLTKKISKLCNTGSLWGVFPHEKHAWGNPCHDITIQRWTEGWTPLNCITKFMITTKSPIHNTSFTNHFSKTNYWWQSCSTLYQSTMYASLVNSITGWHNFPLISDIMDRRTILLWVGYSYHRISQKPKSMDAQILYKGTYKI